MVTQSNHFERKQVAHLHTGSGLDGSQTPESSHDHPLGAATDAACISTLIDVDPRVSLGSFNWKAWRCAGAIRFQGRIGPTDLR
jgi:hypothetical protein